MHVVCIVGYTVIHVVCIVGILLCMTCIVGYKYTCSMHYA